MMEEMTLRTWMQAGIGSMASALLLLILLRIWVHRRRLQAVIPLNPLILFFALSLLEPWLGQSHWLDGKGLWLDVSMHLLLGFALIRLGIALFVEWPYRLRQKVSLPRISRDFLILLAFSIVGFIVLRTRGNFNPAGLITTSAVLTAVIGFAAQSSLSNFFAALMLQMERPFVVGDWIEVDGVEGRVTGITWKATYLETREKDLIYVPNVQVAGARFKNFSRPTRVHVAVLELGVEYGATPNHVQDTVLELLRDHARVMKTPPPEVRLTHFGDFAITYQIRFHHRHIEEEPALLAAISHQLWYALRRQGIRIPFPIRDVQFAHIERKRALLLDEEEQETLRRLLDAVPLFSSLSHAQKEDLAGTLKTVEYGRGEPIVQQGAAGSTLYVLREGRCEVLQRSSGLDRHIAEVLPGDYFGEMSLMTGAPRSATVRALEDCRLVCVEHQALADLLEKSPQLADVLAEGLVRRQAELDRQIPDLEIKKDSLQSFVKRIQQFFKLLPSG